MIVIWILGILLGIFLMYLLALRGRRNQPGWDKLVGWDYAHRGLHGDGVPENSLAAFREAVEQGYGIELDVHLMKDGNLAVIHDSSLKRTAGKEVNVEELTEAQLSDCYLENTWERIPTLAQVLSTVSGRAPIIVELKSVGDNYGKLTRRVCRELKRYHGPVCVKSFDPRCVRYLRKHFPWVIRGQLSEQFMRGKPRWSWLASWILTGQWVNFLTRPDFVSFRFAHRKRPGIYLVKKVWGLKRFAWTITTTEDYRRAKKEGWICVFEKIRP